MVHVQTLLGAAPDEAIRAKCLSALAGWCRCAMAHAARIEQQAAALSSASPPSNLPRRLAQIRNGAERPPCDAAVHLRCRSLTLAGAWCCRVPAVTGTPSTPRVSTVLRNRGLRCLWRCWLVGPPRCTLPVSAGPVRRRASRMRTRARSPGACAHAPSPWHRPRSRRRPTRALRRKTSTSSLLTWLP